MEQETRHKIPCLLPVSLKHMQKMPWYETFDVKRRQACVKFFKKKKSKTNQKTCRYRNDADQNKTSPVSTETTALPLLRSATHQQVQR